MVFCKIELKMTIYLSPENWVKNYADYLFSYALMKTNDRETAADLVQDTFLSALKGQDGFRGDSSEKTWLSRILNNKIIDFYRSKKAEQPVEEYLQQTEDAFHDTFFASKDGRWTKNVLPQHYANSTDDYLQQSDFQRVLEHCLKSMPTKLRHIFVEKYIDDKSSGIFVRNMR